MIRDLTMIAAVFISVVSASFGIYERLEAQNAKGFAYEQAYRILNIVQNANITPFQKATIADAALNSLSEPPPVIDLSRSSADVGSNQACTEVQRSACTTLASDLASANNACAKKDQTACASADDLHRQVIAKDCIACFTK